MNQGNLIDGPLSTIGGGGGFGCAIPPSLSDSSEGIDSFSDPCSDS